MISLQIETTSVCNARCHFCLYPTLKRVKGFMDEELYKKIIREAATIPQINEVLLTGLGEPLLDPILDRRIKFTRTTLPEIDIGMYTNGTFLTPTRFELLKQAGLTTVSISLNAVTKEQRKEVMGLDDWDKVIKHIQYALTHKDHMRVFIKSVLNYDQFTTDNAILLNKIWGNVSMETGVHQSVVEGNWAGESRTIRDFKPNECCLRALTQIYVTVDGRATTCCFDPEGKQVFGNLQSQTLRQVYNSKDYVEFRDAHYRDEADRYEICKGCTRI